MCGIVAAFNIKGENTPSLETIKKQCEVISHRGPNNFGHYADEYVSLGHRRLSIIDLDKRSNQPFVKDNLVIVHNGEVYNYLEIKSDLERNYGCRFVTESDTEVILEAYRQFGVECVDRFNGMFAFIIWDKLSKQLYVCRDRLGVKPLFTIEEGGTHYFASDIKSLWQLFPPEGRMNSAAVISYFSQSYISIPESSTQGINKFPAATWGLFDQSGEKRNKYWDLNNVHKQKMSFGEAVEETEALLKNAISVRLRSDVPVGCFLSGGVDSSLVTAITAGEMGESFHTYSIGFDSKVADESPYSSRVSERYNTQHHHLKLDDSCLESLPKIVWYYSELFGDSSSVPSYFVSEEAHKELTVVLTGDGADEAFGGYVDPYAMYLNRGYKNVPGFLRSMVKSCTPNSSFTPIRWLNKFNDLASRSPEDIYTSLKSGSWHPYANAFKTNGFTLEENASHYLDSCKREDAVDKFVYADISDRMAHDFLVKVDMATMAHSLEARSPFLDYRLFELGYSIDSKVHYTHFKRKAVLKKILEKYVDKDIIHRRKMGFSIPKAQWLRSSKWLPIVKELVSKPSMLGEFIDLNCVNKILSEFERGNDQHANRVWLLIWFQLWHGLFVTKKFSPQMKLSEVNV